MPSVKNPNVTSQNRLAARAQKVRKQAQKLSAAGTRKVSLVDAQRGAKAGLLPTSGPNAAISKKKAKKLEQRMRLNLRRKIELGLVTIEEVEGEVEMKDVSETKAEKKKEKEVVEMDIE